MVDLLVKLLGPTLYNLGVSEADLISYLTQLEGYIYAIIAAVVVLVAVMFLAHFAKKGFRCAVRLEAFLVRKCPIPNRGVYYAPTTRYQSACLFLFPIPICPHKWLWRLKMCLERRDRMAMN